MKVYTGGGDKGKTSLFSGERVAKYSLRIDAYGDLDELNSVIGAVIAFLPENTNLVKDELDHIQAKLFQAGAWMATTPDSSAMKFLEDFSPALVTSLEGKIDELSETLPPLKEFIMPGGCQAASMAHIARTVCRRCERKVIQLLDEVEAETTDPSLQQVAVYLNRLSDYMFVAARYLNMVSDKEDQVWKQ